MALLLERLFFRTMKNLKILVYTCLVTLLLAACNQNSKNKNANSDLDTQTVSVEEVSGFQQELSDLEGLHSKFIREFYQALNKINKRAKQVEDDEQHYSPVQIPEVPYGVNQKIDVPTELDETYAENLQTITKSFKNLTKLNEELRTYSESLTWKEDHGKGLQSIGERAALLIEDHSEALDQLQGDLEKKIGNVKSDKPHRATEKDYFANARLIDELSGEIIKASYNFSDETAYNKELARQFDELKELYTKQVNLHTAKAKDRNDKAAYQKFESSIEHLLEKMKAILQHFEELTDSGSLNQTLDDLTQEAEKAQDGFKRLSE